MLTANNATLERPYFKQPIEKYEQSRSVVDRAPILKPVSIADYGAIGDDEIDATEAVQKASDYAEAIGASLYIPAGIYRISKTLHVAVSIIGDGQNASILHNCGECDALNLSGAEHHSIFRDFSVCGNEESGDGISLAPPDEPADSAVFKGHAQGGLLEVETVLEGTITVGQIIQGVGVPRSAKIVEKLSTGAGPELYRLNGRFNVAKQKMFAMPSDASHCQFYNVKSYQNGRHGFHHRAALGTRFINCGAQYNRGLGWCFDTKSTDIGTAIGVSCLQCDSSFNGAKDISLTSASGGIQINGAAAFSWVGGIIESNEPYGVSVGSREGVVPTRNITINAVHMACNGFESKEGASVVVTGCWAKISVSGCFIAHGAEHGDSSNTCFFVEPSSDHGNFTESGNTLQKMGNGACHRYGGAHWARPQISLGDAPTFCAFMKGAIQVFDSRTNQYTKLPVNRVRWDTNRNFDAKHGFRYQPSVAGYYHFDAIANYFPAVGTRGFLSIWKNGVAGSELRGPAISSGNWSGMTVSGDIFMNGSDDYVELYVFQTSGDTQLYSPAEGLCSFSGHFVRHV